jgi:hypothetical protein
MNPVQRLYTSSRLDSGIFLISLSVLLIELLLTRIFSVTMFYHLSFMVVSLAMLGLGASGLIVNLWSSSFGRDKFWSQLSWAAIIFAITSVFAIGVAFRLPISLNLEGTNWLRLGLIYLLCVIPFLAGGLVVALILTHHAEQANRLYAFDLFGAAVGCLIFIPATNWLGAPTAVLIGAATATLAAIVLAGNDAPIPRKVAIVSGAVLLLLALVNSRIGFYDVRVTKGQQQPQMLAMKWNSFSRVEVIGTPTELWHPRHPVFAGTSKTLDSDFRIPEAWLRYDADAATQITRFDGDLTRLRHLGYDVTSTAHHMRQFHNVLIIGAGGGRDVLTALHMGSGPVTGVEINPLTIQLMRQRFRTFTGGLYADYPGVNIINDEGRNYVRHANSQYDLIQASLVDTWAASAAGAYALTENNLYTVEAFEDYLRHLTPDGVITFSRWFAEPPVESLRVVSLAIEALKRQGIQDPATHIFVVRTNQGETNLPSLGTILVKKSPFTPEELEKLREWSSKMRFLVNYSPDDVAKRAELTDFHHLLGSQSSQFIAEYPFDISAVYDDRPFFFNRVPLLPWLEHNLGAGTSSTGATPLTLGGQTLLISLVATLICTLTLLLLPLIAARWGKNTDSSSLNGVGRSRASLWALYFSGLGLGFIMVEVVLIQRFSLFLGYPVYSLSVVLFTILLASSLGSHLAGRFAEHISSSKMLTTALAILCITLGLYVVFLPKLLDAALGNSTTVRIMLSVLLVAPLGLLMGVPFSTGLRLAGREGKGLISWAWAVNGGSSVFGSTLTILISMTYGFTVSILTGMAAYAVAFGVIAIVVRSQSEIQQIINPPSLEKVISE